MLISFWGRVRKMRIYNAKEVSTHKKADFQTQEIDFFYLCSSTKTPMQHKTGAAPKRMKMGFQVNNV